MEGMASTAPRKPSAKLAAALVAAFFVVPLLGGCYTQAERVRHNIALEADNFNVTRRLAVINSRDSSPLFEMVGTFSIELRTSDNRLVVTEALPDGVFRNHHFHINHETTFVVEDLSGAVVDPDRFGISILPRAVLPFYVVRGDR